MPALLDTYLRPRTALIAEVAASVLDRYPTVFTCQPASLLLIPDAVQLLPSLLRSYNQHAPLQLLPLCWFCGFTIITWISTVGLRRCQFHIKDF